MNELSITFDKWDFDDDWLKLLKEEHNKYRGAPDSKPASERVDVDEFEARRAIEVFEQKPRQLVVRFRWRVPRMELYRGDDPAQARRIRDLARVIVRDMLKLARLERRSHRSELRGKRQRKLQQEIMIALGGIEK